MKGTILGHICLALSALVTILLVPCASAQTCTYNNPGASFSGSYTQNALSSVSSAACSTPADTTAARLLDTSNARTLITAPQTGDFKFLQKTITSSNAAPSFVMAASLSPETLAFPDFSVAAPSGGGCNDALPDGGTGTSGVDAIERHLHRSWPHFGKTYYYGDYNANPPNDPATVTSVTSPYARWTPYNNPDAGVNNPAGGSSPPPSGDEYIYLDSDSRFGWGPAQGTSGPNGVYPLVYGGHPNGCTTVSGLTLTEQIACRVCLNSRGYYLHDGNTAGDLRRSVFKGFILNDSPPIWGNLAWGFGYMTNFQLHDSSNNPLFQMVRDLYQSANDAQLGCPSTPAGDHVGGTFEPAGSADCNIAYPTYNWTAIRNLGMSSVYNDQSNIEGSNNPWGSGNTYPGGNAPSTPASDLLRAGNNLQTFINGQGGVNGPCNSCQTKAVLLIGTGIPCGEARPSGLPSVTIPPCTGECNYVNLAAECNCNSTAGTATNWLPYVANYLYTQMNIRTYFLGTGPHTAAMRRAAAEGKGKYFDANDVQSFHDGLVAALVDIISAATSSATSTVNAVQVNVAGQEELVPRFVARQDVGNYEGHLFKYYLFNEFAANCASAGATVQIPNSRQPVCTATCVCPGGSCTATWLVDSGPGGVCSLITPDNSGFLYKANWNGTTLVPRSAGAVAVWDANAILRTNNWYQRKVYTALDTNGDGKIDYNDGDGTSPAGLYSLTLGAGAGNSDLSGGISDTVADALIPYMGIRGNNLCSNIEDAIGRPLPGGPSLRMRACTKAIINFMLGEDLLNENQLQPTDPNYFIMNRLFMLGDIFHSSPQKIGPPESEATCSQNNRRCMGTLFNINPTNGVAQGYQNLDTPPTVIDPASGASVANTNNIDAYQAYYLNETFSLKRPLASLVGANDGMLHAFQTACFVGTYSQGSPPVVYPSYYDGPGNTGCVGGSRFNGTELWAFVPPDLLSKLANQIIGKHQYFVDSTPMVRDIYAPTTVTPSATKRYTLSGPMDFKRVAIVGEREGGTHWFGLDVTDPTAPQFRWLFPQPNSQDELMTGFTFGDWVPVAPPIVPVRVAAPAADAGYPTYFDSTGTNQPFQEKWTALLPGGYDPYGVVGKSIYMLDAYTGQKVFQTQSAGGINFDFPFAALPASVAWGTQASPSTPDYNKGFSDTAIVGDLGGQIWTLRFNDVGQGTPVTNWYAGRAFRQKAADDVGAGAGEYRMQHKNPIFQMASVARMPEGPLRAFLGTGDRANMAENDLGMCSVYNPLACGRQQCKMTVATNASIGTSTGTSGYSSFRGDILATYISSTTSGAVTPNVCSPASTVLNACVDCSPAPGGQGATLDPTNEIQYAEVNASGADGGWRTSIRTISDSVASERLETSTRPLATDPNTDLGYFNRFLAVNIFDANRTPFASAAQALTYDSRSLTETNLVGLFDGGTFLPGGMGPIVPAQTNGTSNGYYLNYPVLDERTATNSVLLQSCVSWYSMEPGIECQQDSDCVVQDGGTASCNTTSHKCVAPTACGGSASAIPARTAYLYQLNAVTGGSDCGLTSNAHIRTAAATNAFILPPPPPQELISINAAGQIQYSLVTPAGQVSPPASTGSGGNVPFSFYYTIETTRALHQCRHGPPDGGPDPSACY